MASYEEVRARVVFAGDERTRERATFAVSSVLASEGYEAGAEFDTLYGPGSPANPYPLVGIEAETAACGARLLSLLDEVASGRIFERPEVLDDLEEADLL